MLSEEKIKKMVRLSEYENGQGSIDLEKMKYSRMDYIRFQLIKTFVRVFVATLLILLLLALYQVEYLIANVTSLPYTKIIFCVAVGWLLLETVILTIIGTKAAKGYDESKKRVKEYYVTLQELMSLYEKEEQGQEEKAL